MTKLPLLSTLARRGGRLTAVQSAGVSSQDTVKQFKDIPGPSGIKFIYDGIKNPAIKADMVTTFGNWKKTYGNIYKLSIPGLEKRVFIFSPEDGKTLLMNDGKYPYEPAFDFMVHYRRAIRKEMYPETGGLVGSQNEDWYHFRSKVQQDMMRPKSAMFYLKEKQQSDDSIGKEMVNCVKILLGEEGLEMAMGVPIWKYFSTSYYKRYDEASIKMFNISKKLVDRAVERIMESKNTQPDDQEKSVLAKLIDKCGPDSQVPIVMAMDSLIAGIDTTGTAAAFMMYRLGINQDKQELLYKEIVEIVGANNQVTESQLNQMSYLKACIKECLRLSGVILGVSRVTNTDMTLSGYNIPKGTYISYFSYMAGINSSYYSKPQEFIPERWIRGCPEHNVGHPFASIPFSHGARKCIGKRFADLELQVLFVRLLQRYQLEYDGPPVGIATHFVSQPDQQINIKLIKRT